MEKKKKILFSQILILSSIIKKKQPIFRNSFHPRNKMAQNENDVVPLIFFSRRTNPLSNCTTNYRPLRASLRPSTLPRPLNVVLINIHPGRRGAQQTENMNLDNLQPRDPFIARPTFPPSRKRRRSGYIIIKVSRVFETTNDILFFLFPSLEDRLLGARLQRKWWKRLLERMVFVV